MNKNDWKMFLNGNLKIRISFLKWLWMYYICSIKFYLKIRLNKWRIFYIRRVFYILFFNVIFIEGKF